MENTTLRGIGVCEYCGSAKVGGSCSRVMKMRFEEVQNPLDWKAPIDSTVPFEMLAETLDAIEYYTATDAKWEPAKNKRGIKMVRVTSVGYREGPAGP